MNSRDFHFLTLFYIKVCLPTPTCPYHTPPPTHHSTQYSLKADCLDLVELNFFNIVSCMCWRCTVHMRHGLLIIRLWNTFCRVWLYFHAKYLVKLWTNPPSLPDFLVLIQLKKKRGNGIVFPMIVYHFRLGYIGYWPMISPASLGNCTEDIKKIYHP